MLLSEVGNKEIVDMSTGTNHGQLWDAEMVFDRKTGKIKSVLVQNSQSTGLFKKGYMGSAGTALEQYSHHRR